MGSLTGALTGRDDCPAWLPDGRTIAFTQTNPSASSGPGDCYHCARLRPDDTAWLRDRLYLQAIKGRWVKAHRPSTRIGCRRGVGTRWADRWKPTWQTRPGSLRSLP